MVYNTPQALTHVAPFPGHDEWGEGEGRGHAKLYNVSYLDRQTNRYIIHTYHKIHFHVEFTTLPIHFLGLLENNPEK